MNPNTRLRHWPFYLALAGALLSFALSLPLFRDQAIETAAITFFCIYLAITASLLPKLTGSYLRANARDTGEPEPIIFLVTLTAAAVSLVVLFLALNRKDGGSGIELILAFASVALGWATIHTMAALHYAHLHWLADCQGDYPRARGARAPLSGNERARRLRLSLFRLRDRHDRADVRRCRYHDGNAARQLAARDRFLLFQHGARRSRGQCRGPTCRQYLIRRVP
ncbi:hypothetical protein EKH55_1159 [Sinorhizobium alkalisoli]|nr:hypothetical protein EKH55_1159 [Sinorhizobium alkalisoli]